MGRYALLDPEAVRITRLRSGAEIEEIQISYIRLLEQKMDTPIWMGVAEAEPLLARAQARDEELRLLRRAESRLDEGVRKDILPLLEKGDLGKIPKDIMRILRMTNTVYDRFRASQEEAKKAD